eukprot:3351513-Lingulodinium_polyedra.AAC.1
MGQPRQQPVPFASSFLVPLEKPGRGKSGKVWAPMAVPFLAVRFHVVSVRAFLRVCFAGRFSTRAEGGYPGCVERAPGAG